jgi:hypothetical protein
MATGSTINANTGAISNLTVGSVTSTAWLGFTNASGTTLNSGAIFVNGSPVCLANSTNCPASSSGSLDAAYDAGGSGVGRQIYADNGAVEIIVPTTGTSAGLVVRQNRDLFANTAEFYATGTDVGLYVEQGNYSNGTIANFFAPQSLDRASVAIGAGTNRFIITTYVSSTANATYLSSEGLAGIPRTLYETAQNFIFRTSPSDSSFGAGWDALTIGRNGQAIFNSSGTETGIALEVNNYGSGYSLAIYDGGNPVTDLTPFIVDEDGDVFVATSSDQGILNALFSPNGDDLTVAGSIAAASSVYSNSGFIAGAGSTMYADGLISKNNGSLEFFASSGLLVPQTDLGLSLGSSALRFNAYLGNVTTTNVTTTNLYASGIASTTQLFVGGRLVCLADGTNCQSVSASTETLASVTARGSFATTTLQLYGGFVGGSSTVTSTFTVLGDTSLQNFIFTNGTGTNATTTNFAASDRISANIFSGPAGSLTSPTYGFCGNSDCNSGLFQATANTIAIAANGVRYQDWRAADISIGLDATPIVPLGADATVDIGRPTSRFDNGFFVSVSSTNGTFTNVSSSVVTSTNVFVASILTVGGESVCLSNGTNCPASSSGSLDAAYDAGGSGVGRQIYADSGAVEIIVPTTGTSAGLVVRGNRDAFANVAELYATGSDVGLYVEQGNYQNGVIAQLFAPSSLDGGSVAIGAGTNRFIITTYVSSTANATYLSSEGLAGIPRTLYEAAQNYVFRTSPSDSSFGAGWDALTIGRNGQAIFNSSGTETGIALEVNNYGSGYSLAIYDGGNPVTDLTPFIVDEDGDVFVATSSDEGILNTMFAPNGDDLTVAGSIAAASSIYTNAAYFAGAGTTMYADGLISKSNGSLEFFASSGFLLPQTDLGLSLGSASARFNAYLGNVTTTNVTTTNLYASGITSTTQLFVGGQLVCLADGTNCSSSTVESDTLATVTDRGAFATSTLQLYGGFLAASSTVTSTLSLLAQNPFGVLYMDDANAVSSSANFIFDGTPAASRAGLFSIGTNVTNTTAAVEIQLSNTSNIHGLLIDGAGAGTSGIRINRQGQGDLHIDQSASSFRLGTTNHGLLIQANADAYDGTNAYGIRIESLGDNGKIAVGINGSVGQRSDLFNARNESASTTPVFAVGAQGHTSIGSGVGTSTASYLSVYAGVGGAKLFEVNSTSVQAFTADLFLNGVSVCLEDGTNCLVQSAQTTSTLAEVTARGSFATTTIQLYGGFIGASSTVTSTFTVLGGTLLQAVTATNVTATNINVSNTVSSTRVVISSGSTNQSLTVRDASTDLRLFTASGEGSIGTITSSNLNFVTGGSSRWFIDTSGNLRPTADSTYSLGSTSDRIFSGHFINLLATNGTTTNATTTNLYVSGIASTTQLFVGGRLVCLVNGTNCPADGAPLSTSTLATVSAKGSFATTTLQLYGGFIGASSTVTSTFTVLGGTLLQTVTATNVTATNLSVSGLASTTRLFAGAATTTKLDSQAVLSLINGDRTITAASSVQTFTNPRQVLVRGNQAYVLSDGQFGTDEITVYDISDPSSPTTTQQYFVNGADQFDVQGDKIFVAATGTGDLVVIDMRNKASVTSYTLGGLTGIQSVRVAGQYLYVKGSNPDFSIYRIEEAPGQSMLRLLSTMELGGSTVPGIAVQGSFVYLQAGISTMRVIDVSNPGVPRLAGFINGSVFSYDFTTQENYLYTAGNWGSSYFGASFDVYEITNPAQSYFVTSTPLGATTTNLFVSGRYAYTATSTGRIFVMDILNPRAPVKYTLTTPSATEKFDEIYVEGRYAYVLDSTNARLHIFDLGGVETTALSAATVRAGTIQAWKNSSFMQSVEILGGLAVGQQGIRSVGGIDVVSDSGSTTARFVNTQLSFNSSNTNWGIYTNALAVGGLGNQEPTGTSNNSMVVNHNSGVANGICIDDLQINGTCPLTADFDGYGVIAQSRLLGKSFTAGGFDTNTASATFSGSAITTAGNANFDITVGNKLTILAGGNSTIGTSVGALDLSSASTMNISASGLMTLYTTAGNISLDPVNGGSGVITLGDAADFITFGGQVNSSITPSADDLFSLGSASLRWDGYFSDVTSTNATTTNLFVSNLLGFNTASGSRVNLAVPQTITSASISSGSSGNSPMDAQGDTVVRSYYSTGFDVIDISDRTAPEVMSSVSLSSSWTPLVNGRYIYVFAFGGGLNIYDISNKRKPILLSTLNGFSGSGTDGLTIQGSTLFAADAAGLHAIDVSDPRNPRFLDSLSLSGSRKYGVLVKGGAAYVTGGNVLYVVDVTDPTLMVLTKTLTGYSSLGRLAANETSLYMVDTGLDSLLTIDIRSATSPTPVATTTAGVTGGTGSTGVVVAGDSLFIGNSSDVGQYDISDPRSPVFVKTFGSSGVSNTDLDIVGTSLIQTQSASLVVYDLGGLRTPTLHAGSADIGVLNVNTDLHVSRNGFFGGLSVGPGGILSQGPSNFGASSTSATVSIVNSAPTSLTTSWGAYIDSVLIGTTPSATGTADHVLSSFGGAYMDRLLLGDKPNLASHDSYALDISITSGLPAARIMNTYTSSASPFTAWGVWTDSILVSDDASPNANRDRWTMILEYASGTSKGGLCVDDESTAGTCGAGAAGRSIVADGTITAGFFDLAERYVISGAFEPGDLLVTDPAVSSTVMKSTGVPYDPTLIGIVSTQPGLELGTPNPSSTEVAVALAGRVPTKLSMENGPVRIGDRLTSARIPGYAMKATKPGMIVGYALDNADTTSTIEAFVNVGYYAGATLQTDGTLAILTDHLLVEATSTASSTSVTADSWGLTFRGSAWDSVSSTAVHRDFTLLNDMVSATNSLFAIRSSSGTNLFTVGQDGMVQVTGDLSVVGRLYPSARGVAQNQYYVFVDNSSSTSQYISTNADGWQAQTSYDLAERYFSEHELEAGDLVMPSADGLYGVAKAVKGSAPVMGIVSTKPGFLLGRNATDTYPIALSGRVPTKVMGSVHIGDLLVVSDTAGVATKATENGYVIGIALESYDGADIGMVETFVAPHWNGSFGATQTISAPTGGTDTRTEKLGFADIASGSKKVHVAFPSLGAYPNVKAVPYGDAGTWWIENVTDTGFDIVMRDTFARDLRFAWSAQPTQTGDILHNSDGTFGPVDPTTGVGPAMGGVVTGSSTEPDVTTEPVTETPPADTGTGTTEPAPTTEPVAEPVPEPLPIVDTSADGGFIDLGSGGESI